MNRLARAAAAGAVGLHARLVECARRRRMYAAEALTEPKEEMTVTRRESPTPTEIVARWQSEARATATAEERRRLIRSLETARLKAFRTTAVRDWDAECALCPRPITEGELYADAGRGRRAHYSCVPGLGRAREPWQVSEIDLRLPDGPGVQQRSALSRRGYGSNDEDEI